MRSWWFPRRASELLDRPATDGVKPKESEVGRPSPYSPQYETIISQGHERPTPTFSAPALIWHVAIWPRRQTDLGDNCDPNDTAGEADSRAAKRTFEVRRLLWVEEINRLIEGLQRKSSPRPDQPPAEIKIFKPIYPHELERRGGRPRGGYVTPLQVLERDTLSFALWWADTTDPDPAGNAIRLRVHAELNADYACLSFYMDIGQRWNAAHSAHRMLGARRSKLLQAVHEVGDICMHQFLPVEEDRRAPVDMPAVPEVLHSTDRRSRDTLDRALRDARNLLYVDAWEAFCAEFHCGLGGIAGLRGEVFANFRGLVMATPSLPPGGPLHDPQPDEMASLGSMPFPHFSANAYFNADGAEANGVVKAFWPFLRRVTPRADYREFIACGVLSRNSTVRWLCYAASLMSTSKPRLRMRLASLAAVRAGSPRAK